MRRHPVSSAEGSAACGRYIPKTPDRIGALGIVLVMALLVYGILEYRVREQWAKQEKPLQIPGRSKDYKPTGQVLLALLQSVKVILLQYSGRTERVVEMAGYDMTIYTTSRFEAVTRLTKSGKCVHNLSKAVIARRFSPIVRTNIGFYRMQKIRT